MQHGLSAMTWPARCIASACAVLVSHAVLAVVPMGVAVESVEYLAVGFSGAIPVAQLRLTNNYRISSPTDPNYLVPRTPLKAGRRSQLLSFPPYPNYSLSNTCGHWAYLQAPFALQSGHAYTVRVDNVNGATTNVVVAYDEDATINRNIKLNQVGYPPGSVAKFGYVGGYLGDLGAMPLTGVATAYVCNASTHAVALAVPITVRAAQSKSYYYMGHTETELQMTGENVSQFNFSALTTPGKYYARVPRLGRSFTFAIDSNVYYNVLTNIVSAMYLQRCGIVVTTPYSSVCMHGICHTQAMQMTSSSNVDDFITPGSGLAGKYLRAVGGYHDAGDYDRRVYHIQIVRDILDLYAMLPPSFTDGQFRLPDAGNGVPDVLDEAWWGLKVWFDLQDTNDGGVYAGTERLAEGGMREPADDYRLDYYVRTKAAVNSAGAVYHAAWFAAAAAQMARLLQPFDAARAQLALDRARLAYTYAVGHGMTDADKADAAAELFCTTGELQYQQAFLATSTRTSFSMALCALANVDAAAKATCRAYWIAQADTAQSYTETYNSYRLARNPFRPIRYGGGSGGGHDMWSLCKGYTLSSNALYLIAAQHNANFILGCNPLNRSWITGVGSVAPENFLHRLFIIDRLAGRGSVPPPGYHVYGPFAQDTAANTGGTHDGAFWTNLYPATVAYPKHRAYVASEWMPGMNEFTVQETMVPSYCLFAFLNGIEQPVPLPEPGIALLAAIAVAISRGFGTRRRGRLHRGLRTTVF